MNFCVSAWSVRIPVATDPGIQKLVTDFYPQASLASSSEFNSPSCVDLPLSSSVYIFRFHEEKVERHTIYNYNVNG